MNTPQSSQRTILVIEDDLSTRNLLQKSFEKAGYQVLIAKNGREGLATALKTPPDLVLSDVMMPEMNGYELCQKLKTHPTTKALPVILLTARGDTESTVEGFEAGADEYIAKPFEMQEVLARVGRILRWMDQKQDRAVQLTGSFDKTPMFDLLRFCEEHRITGIVHVTQPAADGSQPTEGKIHLQLGEIQAIELRDITDMTEALDELLEWTEGTFTVEQQALHLPEEAHAEDTGEAEIVSETAQETEEPEPEASAPEASPQQLPPATQQALQDILEELRGQSDDLESAVITDAAGTPIRAVHAASSGSPSLLSTLLTKMLHFGQQASQRLELGQVKEAIITSDDTLILVYPIEQVGALGVQAPKESQGMLRWNCQEALEKISALFSP
ncbi:response regulator [candidate division KSB3 bacterium]|uniref:Response regulator n=1 Tax=candidate division KSB3 bacterium TaxID=2044937 RepID=A0A9D5Q620_9BACT|nr:response regulator [candidate division KSB3 bacterium]